MCYGISHNGFVFFQAAAAFYPNQTHVGHASSQASSLVSLQQLTQRLDLLQPHAGVPQPPVAAKSPPVGGGGRPGGKSGGSKARTSATSCSLGPPAASAAPHLALPPGYGYPGHHPGSVAAAAGSQSRMVGGGVPGQISRPPNVTINPSIMQAQYNAMQQYNAYNAMLNPALVS